MFFSGNVILNIDVHLEELNARNFKELFHFLGKNMFMVIKARQLFTSERLKFNLFLTALVTFHYFMATR